MFVNLVGGDEQIIKDAIEEVRKRDHNPNGLSLDERIAIWLYTSTDAKWYEDINHQLRNTPSPDVTDFTDILNGALSKISKFDDDAYRGIRVPNADLSASYYVKGKRVKFRAFTSSARVERKAFVGNVLFIIGSKNGRILGNYADKPGEDEILFAAGSEFEVVDVEHTTTKVVITLDEV